MIWYHSSFYDRLLFRGQAGLKVERGWSNSGFGKPSIWKPSLGSDSSASRCMRTVQLVQMFEENYYCKQPSTFSLPLKLTKACDVKILSASLRFGIERRNESRIYDWIKEWLNNRLVHFNKHLSKVFSASTALGAGDTKVNKTPFLP